jgi:Cdc6-like AAA superfamily ATPase
MPLYMSFVFLVEVHLADCPAEAISTEAWVDNFSVPLELDYSRNTSFTGRQEDLERIHHFICNAKSKNKVVTPLVIYGTGGVGKTQLVREYIYAHTADFKSIIWIDAQSLQTTQTSFLGFMQKLIHLHARRSTESPPSYVKITRHLSMTGFVDETGRIILNQDVLNQVVSAVREWLNRSGNTSWLLVFDNVDDLETFRISDFFPNSASGNIILTSRRPECGRLGEGWELNVMQEQESINRRL